MIKDIEKISKIRNIKTRLYKKKTMLGLYYKEMINRIENPKIIKQSSEEDIAKEEVAATKQHPLSDEGNFLDKLC